nr:hypothetical protein [Tanacetum cinerariifolium]
LIHNSILNVPYARRMIPEPGDANREVTVTETFYVQTDDELSDKELKQIEADDQVIQTILLSHPEDIYAAVDSFNQNLRVQNIGNQNGLIGVLGNGNQNQIKNDNLVAKRAEGNAAGQNGNQIRCYNCRGQASTSGTQTDSALVYDSDGSAEEQCLSKKLNALHLRTEKKKLKSDFKTREDEILDKQIQLEKKLKELNNILVKIGQSIQTIHMLTPKPDSFYNTEQKMALGYQNPFYLKQAQKKQQSLYDGKVLLEKHDPPAVHDSEETLQLAQESHKKIKQLNKEIKPANYTKINHLSWVFVPQTAMSREELYFLNNSKTANVSKSISIPNEDFSYDTTPSVACKFLNEVKSTIVILQHVVKHRMTIETHNWSSSAHQDLHKIVSDQKDNTHDMSENTKFAKQPIMENLPKVGVNNNKVIAPGMFRISLVKTSRYEKNVPTTVKASDKKKSITVSQPPVITKKDVNSKLNGLSSKGVDNTKTRRPQPRSNTKHDKVLSTSKSSQSKNKEA